MLRIFQQLPCLTNFNNLSEIHHGHSVCDMLNDADVMADEQVRQTQLLLEVKEEVDDLSLDRHIQ